MSNVRWRHFQGDSILVWRPNSITDTFSQIWFDSQVVPPTLSEAQTRTWHRWMVKMAWERELWTFIWVLAVVRDRAPNLRHCIIWKRQRGEFWVIGNEIIYLSWAWLTMTEYIDRWWWMDRSFKLYKNWSAFIWKKNILILTILKNKNDKDLIKTRKT